METKSKISPKFEVGDKVEHILGLSAVISRVYTEATVKENQGTEQEVSKTVPLEQPVYDILYLLTNNKIVSAQALEMWLTKK